MKISRREFPLLIFSILIPQLVGTIGALFTFPSIANWYVSLQQPSFTPPDWVFGPVWTALYLLMGISLYLVVRKIRTDGSYKTVQLFFMQLLLNLLWSIVFFGEHSLGGAMVVIIALWVLIILTILKFSKISKNAGYLLLPYLAWVTFAAYLNFAFLFLNS